MKSVSQQSHADKDILFRFAIVADTHMNPREGETSSPWLTNQHANDRARAAVHEINKLCPAFTIHLGDIVHPIPAQASYEEAATRAVETFSALKAPVHYVPGNHDVGDKPLDWMPAEVVNDAFIDIYKRHFGADYYSFDANGCRFVVLNAQILNSGMRREEEQWDWLESTMVEANGMRIFIFTHYPLYITSPDEIEHYDNLGRKPRQRLLEMMVRYKVEACFAGHVHNFFYDRHQGIDMYVLPAVSAVRHDYSELFKTAPLDSEFGRDDNAKLGFFIVDVFKDGHIAHFIRSYGAAIDEYGGHHALPLVRVPRIHSRLHSKCPLGVDLRQAWAQAIAITPSGAVDEFYRKKARNDYMLAALWEMGIQKLRVPLDDLTDPEARIRIRMLHQLGHQILLYSYSFPEKDAAEILFANVDCLDGLEIVVPSHQIDQALSEAFRIQKKTGLPTYISRLRSSSEAQAAGAKYTHFIRHGFSSDEMEEANAVLHKAGTEKMIHGFVFRVPADDKMLCQLNTIANWASRKNLHCIVHIILACENPAQNNDDQTAISNSVAEALFCGHVYTKSLTLYLDTLADIDRGYFPRLGLVDRSFNPRLAGKVFAALEAELGAASELELCEEITISDGRIISAKRDKTILHLILPSNEITVPDLMLSIGLPNAVRAVDLETGKSISLDFEETEKPKHFPIGDTLKLHKPTLLFIDVP